MTEIVFVRTRWFYQSYTDYWKLVELSGFPTCYTDEVDTTAEKVYILSPHNGEWGEVIKAQDEKHNRIRNCHLILWNLERPDGSAGGMLNFGPTRRQLIYDRMVDEVWVSDSRLADETGLRFVVLGSDEGLGQPSTEKKYDFCHMSYEVPRRQGIHKHFQNIGPNGWGEERDAVLKASKFGLALHQDRHPFQEPLRMALFAAYGLPIVCETLIDSFPWSSEFCIFSTWDEMVGKLKQVLTEDYEPYREMGLKARERMTKEFQFGKIVRRAVSESVEKWR